MTGETPEVRSDRRKPREKMRELERKREKDVGRNKYWQMLKISKTGCLPIYMDKYI